MALSDDLKELDEATTAQLDQIRQRLDAIERDLAVIRRIFAVELTREREPG